MLQRFFVFWALGKVVAEEQQEDVCRDPLCLGKGIGAILEGAGTGVEATLTGTGVGLNAMLEGAGRVVEHAGAPESTRKGVEHVGKGVGQFLEDLGRGVAEKLRGAGDAVEDRLFKAFAR
eukprot:Skav224693  [mRNA]  locus=scaffold3171:190115:190474:+ [translate_table: standard]